MSNTKITFYPVKNGDTNLIEFSDGVNMLIDCKFRSEAEAEDNDDYNVINDLLTNKLTTKKKGSSLSECVCFNSSRPGSLSWICTKIFLRKES